MNRFFNKYTWQLIYLGGVVLIAQTAGAASFDCAKASTKVEHIICDNPDISKLDEELSAAYKTAVQNKQHANTIKQAQKQWMKERNGCADAGCVKQAYEARLAALVSSVVKNVQQNISALSEKAKGEIASKILNGSEITFKPGLNENDREFVNFCNTFIDDFKRQRGIEYIEPVFRTDDYSHPVFVKLRKQCPNYYWPIPPKCDTAYLASKLRGLDGDAAEKKAQDICKTKFGTTKYALYKIDFGDHREHVIYSLRIPHLYPEELLALLDTSHRSDDPRYDDIRPLSENFFQNGYNGYRQYNFSACSNRTTVVGLATGGFALPETYLGFIKYKDRYFTYDLQRLDRQRGVYKLVVGGRNPTCSFEAVKSKSSRRGSKK